MFSITTIASSTRMPIDSDSASIEMLLKLKPMYDMNAKVATTEVGIASAAMKVARMSCKNTRMMMIVSSAPRIRSNLTSSIACSANTELSVGIASVTPFFSSSGRSSSIAARTSSASATTLAPLCLRTTSARAGSPLRNEAERASSTVSMTSATSLTRIAPPPTPRMTMSPISTADLTSPLVLIVSSLPPALT